ncbi:MAG: hypothetical protein IT251_03490 [Chitinophagaceae bacterium]|nr:hypothetical protein [Chitinophagaceae bacterium]
MQTSTTTSQIQELCLEALTNDNKSIIHYALTALQTECERHRWAAQIHPTMYNEAMIAYYNNITNKCAEIKSTIELSIEPENISLLKYFSK